jgi:hypothetical protein
MDSGVKIGPKAARTGWIWEHGKPYKLSATWRSRKLACNGWDRSSNFALLWKEADFLWWWFMVMKDKTFTIKASQITSLKEKWATLNSRQMELQWKSIPWKAIEKRIDKLQSRITVG